MPAPGRQYRRPSPKRLRRRPDILYSAGEFRRQGITAGLRQMGIRVSTWGDDDYPNFIRVSTGRPEEPDAFLDGFREVMGQR